jgi:hypothetical protein
VALVILIAGIMSAGWLAELVAREAEQAGLRGSNAFRRVVFITIVAIAAGRYVQDGTEVGDVISVDGVEGTIEELGYASITVRSEDGHLYRIPNRTLLENVVRKRA